MKTNTSIKLRLVALIIPVLILSACGAKSNSNKNHTNNRHITLGAESFSSYLPLLKNKRVGIVANHSTTIGEAHLVDTLMALDVNVTKIYSPEHGFRGDGDAGELIESHFDQKTALPIISLYGNKKKPSHADFDSIDVVVFDIQDVGIRYYTYISTMHYVMETCAEINLPLIVLDRPNPNGFYVDGPVLEPKYKSFVGMHPVPIVHGMTIGEYAKMVNGERWLNDSLQCKLTVIPCENYHHDSTYVLPIRPSPNLPNQTSIYLYPSLGFFEGTSISIGRGTDFPFQVFGHPSFTEMPFEFTPGRRPKASKNPPLLGELCHGINLQDYQPDYFLNLKQINLEWLLFAYRSFPDKDNFFNSYFNLLAGNNTLKQQVKQNTDEHTIRMSWKPGVEKFMLIRKKYLLYPDFTKNQLQK